MKFLDNVYFYSLLYCFYLQMFISALLTDWSLDCIVRAFAFIRYLIVFIYNFFSALRLIEVLIVSGVFLFAWIAFLTYIVDINIKCSINLSLSFERLASGVILE